MADNPNLNYFKDPTTKLWREPKTDADFTTFKAKQPKAYDTYMKTYGTSTNTAAVPSVGTYDADGTRIGSGTAASNYTGTRWGNTANTPAVQTGYSSNVLSGTGATNAAGSWDNINMDNFDSSFDAGMAGMTPATATVPPAEAGFFSGMDLNPFDKDGALSTDVKGAGGSNFSSAAAGLGSLYGIYAAHQGIGAAKDALNFQKQQYADQQAQQARANKKQDDFGLALASALPAKRVG